ncbi:MAG: Crp/Fnr family transcriptional regulator [Tannerellaceae bacterium]|nr:Crp/Fnr family transcriptional regulator [Tannerellaceae bacterium]
MDIDQIIDQIYTLPEQSKTILKKAVTETAYPKNHVLLRADKVETTVYFIRKGIVRAYIDSGESEQTFWFGKEGDTVVSMKSYVAGEKGYENIELLEDCILYQIDGQQLQELFEKDIYIANWGRKFAEQELLKTEARLISRQTKTATERYTELIRKNPELLQRVQLGYIASYLGITQVSLSRIRAEIR